MNALSLRVSSIRNGENLKKNSELRVAVLRLPTRHQLLTSTTAATAAAHIADDDLTNLKREFSSATSIDQQLVTIRKCFTTLSPDIDNDSLGRIIQLLVDVFFFAPLKHPVRNAIAKLLQKTQLFHGPITACLVATITEQTSDGPPHRAARTAVQFNTLITSIGGCFENVPVALIAVKQCLPAIFAAIHAALTAYGAVLQQPGCSPAARSELHISVHSAVRLTLSCVQLCFDQTSVAPIAAALRPIVAHCERFLGDDAVPMDTKVNCGQLLLLHAKLLDRLDDVFDEIEAAAHGGDASVDRTLRTLVLCVGTVTTIREAHLEEPRGCTVLQHVVAHLVRIAGRSAIEQNVLIAAARGLVQLTKALLQFQLTAVVDAAATAAGGQRLQCLQQLTAACLDFVWTFAEHHLDSVRHLSRDVLCNLLRLAHKHRTRGWFAGLVDECTATAAASATSAPVRCLAIDQLGQALGADAVLRRLPDVGAVLTAHLAEANWAACYDRLMVSGGSEAPLAEWYERWVRPVLMQHRADGSRGVPLAARQAIIGSAIRAQPAVVALIVAERATLPVDTYLFVMWTVRKAASVSTAAPSAADWRAADDPVLIAAKWHASDAVRIMPLRILVEVQRTTEPFTGAELAELIAYLEYNCNSQCPAMRMQVLALMQKAFQRIEASHAVAVRRDTDAATVRQNEQFLLQLRDLCVGNLFAGANFGRRSVSLVLLLQAVRTLRQCGTAAPTVWTQRLLDEMRRTVTDDTYESNKVLAIDVLRCCPTELNPMPDPVAEPAGGLRALTLAELAQMLTSVRPGQSLAAAYLTEYCCLFGWHFDSTLAAVEWCEQLLLDGLRQAEVSLLAAARQNPLYGLVYCIKHLVGTVDLKAQPTDRWRPFVSRFLGTCKALLAVVAPIVNSSSPEGHMTEATGAGGDGDGDDATSTTSQMLLLCAWRTVKEVSLFLGELTLHAPIVRTSDAGDADAFGLLSVADVLSIGRTFQTMLAETKHRGAFEQAYVGFSKLCVRLWRSNEPQLHCRPMLWLRTLIDLIASNEPEAVDAAGDKVVGDIDVDTDAAAADDADGAIRYDSICATRRSAGVPFMIQALITAELQVCSAHGLHYGMRRLLALAADAVRPETRTHALNILRALFRCTDLGEAVAEYVAAALCCSIDGYAAADWPERTAATLLFAALMTRVFGVQRGRLRRPTDTLSVRNRMTGRIFFLRYPRLYDYLAGQLATAERRLAAAEGRQSQSQPAPATLRPLLLLLSRLYASALEGCESSLRLGAFLPAVQLCSVRCADVETRRLAVRSMAALLAPTAVWPHLAAVVDQLHAMQTPGAGRFDSNAAHGYLMQIEVLVRTAGEQQALAAQAELWALLETLLAGPAVWSAVPRRINCVLLRAFVDALVAILLRLRLPQRVAERPAAVTALRRLCERLPLCLASSGHSAAELVALDIGRPEAVKSCLLLAVLVPVWCEAGVGDASFVLFRGGLAEQSIEHVETVLNLMLLLLAAERRIGDDATEDLGDADDDGDEDFAYTLLEYSVAEAISRRPKQLEAIVGRLKSSPQLIAELLEVTREPRFDPVQMQKAFEVLGQLDGVRTPRCNAEELAWLVRSIEGRSDNVRNAMLPWFSAQARLSSDEVVNGILYRQLLVAADPNALDKLRLTAAVCLCNMNHPTDPILLPKYCHLMLVLLRDDHPHVRRQMAKHVQTLCECADDAAPIIASRAVEMFLQWLDTRLQSLEQSGSQCTKAHYWTLLMDQELAKCACTSADSRPDASEVFNQNEANLFGESLHTARMMLVWLKRNCTSNEMHLLDKYQYLEQLCIGGRSSASNGLLESENGN